MFTVVGNGHEIVYIFHGVNNNGRGMNPIILPPTMIKQ